MCNCLLKLYMHKWQPPNNVAMRRANSCLLGSAARLYLAATIILAMLVDAHAYVVGGVVLPHGALLLEPRNSNLTDASGLDVAFALHYAALETGRFLRDLEPELLVVVTPHGLAVPQVRAPGRAGCRGS